MQHIHLKEYGEHQCRLKNISDNCLPDLPPNVSKYKQFLNNYRKYLTVSISNPRTKQFFKSKSSLIAEKKRQIHTVPKYIIHPFSQLNGVVECIMCFLWFFGYLFDPIFVAFYETETVNSPLALVSFIANILTALHMGLCFITGYQISKTKEIVLSPRKIIFRYLKTYFIFDVIGAVPFRLFATISQVDMDDVYYNLLSAFHLVRIVRIYTAFYCFRQITLLLHLDDPSHVLLAMFVLTYFFLHWLSCVVYLSNKMLYYITGTINGHSWLRKLGVSAAQDVNWYRKYIVCLHTVITTFYSSGLGMQISYVFCEHILLSIIMIFGSVYYVYALVVILQLVRSATTSETKYEEFLFQLNDYMRVKMLPDDLRSRILLYYEHRFQKKFFREQAILSLLSEHLRHEIFLQSCQHLMEKVTFFKKLPKYVVGLILARLKHEVFLPNDIIISTHGDDGAMYFISYGSVAIYNTDGQECLHLTDGMHFGSSTLAYTLEKSMGYYFVATEMTECYRWDKMDVIKCATTHSTLADAIEKVKLEAANRLHIAEEEIERHKRGDIVANLRQLKIIETGILRRDTK